MDFIVEVDIVFLSFPIYIPQRLQPETFLTWNVQAMSLSDFKQFHA